MRIEFIPPVKPGYKAWIAWGALLLLALALGGVTAGVALRKLEVEAKIGTLRADRIARARPLPPPKLDASFVAMLPAATAAWQQGRFKTADALPALEQVAVPGIAIQSLEMSEAEHRVGIELSANSYDVLTDFIAALNHADTHGQWRLLKATGASGGDGLVRAGLEWQ